MAALPVQYSPDGSSPVVANGGAPLRRTMSPGGSAGFKARSGSSLSLVSHGDDRSGSPASDLAHSQFASAADGQVSAAASSPNRRPSDAARLQGSSSAADPPQSAGAIAGSSGGADASPSVSPSKQNQSVRRLSPFAADACQDAVAESAEAARKDATEHEKSVE